MINNQNKPYHTPKSYPSPDYRRYEAEKQAWMAQRPKATPEEYTEAMQKIATRCRI